jgi:hypothetical protein
MVSLSWNSSRHFPRPGFWDGIGRFSVGMRCFGAAEKPHGLKGGFQVETGYEMGYEIDKPGQLC